MKWGAIRTLIVETDCVRSGKRFSVGDIRDELADALDQGSRTSVTNVLAAMRTRGELEVVGYKQSEEGGDVFIRHIMHPLVTQPMRPSPKFEWEYSGPGPLEWNL